MSKKLPRKLPNWKYELAEEYQVQLPPALHPELGIHTEFLALTSSGILSIAPGYAYDGASGPTVDTKSSLRGALVHDALYQLMRGKFLDYKVHRKPTDKLFYRIIREDGMNPLRAYLWYRAVRRCGKKFTKPQPELRDHIHTAP